MSNEKPESHKAQTNSTILDNALYKSILKILGCEKSVRVRWRSWNGEKIPAHIFEAVFNTPKIVYTKERTSALCSMLAEALNQDFGQEKFNIKESDNQEDYSFPYEDSVNYAGQLFKLIYEIADIENNSHAKYIYDSLYRHCLNIAELIDSSICAVSRNTYSGMLVSFIAPFIYVFYVELVCESFKNNKVVNRSDIAELFVNIFCSKVILDHFKEYKDFEFDFSNVNESKEEYIFLVKYGKYSLKKAIYKEESENDYKKRVNGALRDLIDKIYMNTIPDEMPGTQYLSMTDSGNNTSSKPINHNNKTKSFIAKGGKRINFLEFKKTIDESELDKFDYGWFIRWFIRKGLFILEQPEIANGAMHDAELYTHFRCCSEKRKSESSEEYSITSEDYLDFVNGYCNLYYSETDISHVSFLSLLLSNGLLVVNRIQMSTNDMNNTELKNRHKYDLITDYWADNYGDNDNDEDDYDDDE